MWLPSIANATTARLTVTPLSFTVTLLSKGEKMALERAVRLARKAHHGRLLLMNFWAPNCAFLVILKLLCKDSLTYIFECPFIVKTGVAMLCPVAEHSWGDDAVGVYGDEANDGLCSDSVEYAALAVFFTVAFILLCTYRRYFLAWVLGFYSFLNLAFGAIVIRNASFNVLALLFNSRQVTMPAVTCVTAGLYLYLQSTYLITKFLTILYGAFVSTAASQYMLEADSSTYFFCDVFGIVLAMVWAFSSYRIGLGDSDRGSKA